MDTEHPYQLVAFVGSTPKLGERIYEGKNGWYPQIAMKRRFKVRAIDEGTLTRLLQEFCNSQTPLVVRTGDLERPANMPVRVVPIVNPHALTQFHIGFIAFMGDRMTSRYPDRDGPNYFPHITAEYGDKLVIDVKQYTNTQILIDTIALVKDDKETKDTLPIAYFELPKGI